MKNIIIVFLLLFSLFPMISNAQSNSPFETVIQSGHESFIQSVDISPNGKFVATGGRDKKVLLWDVNSGIQLRSFVGHLGDIETVKFTPDSKFLLTGSRDRSIRLWNISTGEEIFNFKDHSDGISSISLSSDGKYFVSGSWDGTIKLWDINERMLLKSYNHHKSWVLSVAFSQDNKFIVSGSNDNKAKILNIETGTVIKNYTPHTEMITAVDLSPNGKFLASGSTDHTLKITDVTIDKNKQLIKSGFNSNCNITFNSDGNLCAFGYFDDAVLMDVETGAIVQRFSQIDLTSICISPDSKYLVTTGNKSAIIWDIKSGKQVKVLTGHSSAPEHVSFNVDGKKIYASYSDQNLRTWDLLKARIENSELMGSQFIFSPDRSKRLLVIPNGVLLIDVNTRETLKKITFDSEVKGISFSPDGNFFAVSSYLNAYVYSSVDYKLISKLGYKSKIAPQPVFGIGFSPDNKFLAGGVGYGYIAIWKLPGGGKPISIIDGHDAFVSSIKFSLDGTRMITNSVNDYSTKIWDLKNETQLSNLSKSSDYIYGSGANSINYSIDQKFIITGNLDQTANIYTSEGDLFKMLKGHTGSVLDANFNNNVDQVVTSSYDKSIRIWDLKSGESLVQMLTSNDGSIIITDDGYYTFSKQSNQAVHFVQGTKGYTFENFDLVYNRPDKVLEKLGKADPETILAYQKAYEKRLRKMGFDPSDFEETLSMNVPELEINTNLDLLSEVTSADFQFSISASDELYSLDRLFVNVNGVPLYGVKGKSLLVNKSKVTQQNINIRLNAGKNTIKVSVMNEKGIESLIEQFEINCKPSSLVIPNLHVIAIGVSKFQESAYNLTYAHKDATDLSELLKNAKGYGHVFVHNFTNENATVGNILQVRSELEKTNVDDEVVVFIASHGLLDDELDYYIAMHNTEFENPKNGGLRYDVIENLIDGIPARNKLMLIDACHSGEVDKEESTLVASSTQATGSVKSRGFKNIETKSAGIGLESSFDLMKELFADLRRNNGAVVISSASGKEFAFESSEWQNGVFTYSLLEGLKSGNADANKDKTISVSEVRDYVSKRVVELTDGKQNPTSRTENLENDFKVW